MSAPVSHHPLVVNTQDGSCWIRRAVSRDGRGLYALAGSVAGVPDEVLVSLADLAELGITGSAYALPMPAGPEPQPLPVDADRAKAPWGRGEDGRPLLPMGAHWTDIPELVDRTFDGIQARVDQAQSGHWYVSPIAELPDTVCTRVDGYHRTVGRFTNVLPADLEFVLHAHDDLSWCLEMIAKLRARVAEMEHTVQKMCDALNGHDCPPPGESPMETVTRVAVRLMEAERLLAEAEPTDGITRRIAPTQALREDDPAEETARRSVDAQFPKVAEFLRETGGTS